MSTPSVDVDRVLQARYLAAVVQQLEARGLQVDAAVLDGPGRPGGTVVLADPPRSGSSVMPTYARWDGGRSWTLLSFGTRGGVRRRRLRKHRLPAPHEVAQFVAQAAAGERTRAPRALQRHPVSAWRPARGH